MSVVDATLWQMIAVFALIIGTLGLYITEKLPLELTSFAVICVLMVLFHLFPVAGLDGDNRLSPTVLLSGFANPALLTVLALLVLGAGLERTGALDRVAVMVHGAGQGNAMLSIVIALLVVVVVSAFLNNIPVVVLFVPVMQALSTRLGRPASRYMMPLSFAAILGGMTTLIGSSTNLLVSGSLEKLGEQGFDFFSFSIPGLVVAGVGLVYVMFVAPRFLPDREAYTPGHAQSGGKQFLTEMKIVAGSGFEGMAPVGGFFSCPERRDGADAAAGPGDPPPAL